MNEPKREWNKSHACARMLEHRALRTNDPTAIVKLLLRVDYNWFVSRREHPEPSRSYARRIRQENGSTGPAVVCLFQISINPD